MGTRCMLVASKGLSDVGLDSDDDGELVQPHQGLGELAEGGQERLIGFSAPFAAKHIGWLQCLRWRLASR